MTGLALRIPEEVTPCIDCDQPPFVPEGWEVLSHRSGGLIAWEPSQTKFWQNTDQRYGRYVPGKAMSESVQGKLVMNACVLDYLLAHPELIPIEWRAWAPVFWGTRYRHENGFRCVRFMYFYDERWRWGSRGSMECLGPREAALCRLR